jgi:hypothetical protein
MNLPRNSDVPDQSLVVHASVIVQARSGKSVKHAETAVTPENVNSFLATKEALKEAADSLAKLGFFINLLAPTHLNISADPTLFEHVFNAKLVEREYPVFMGLASDARQRRFEANQPLTVPPELSPLVQSIDLAPPVILYTSAAPPALSYYHLEVPDDIARGMDATRVHQRGLTGCGIELAMVDTGFTTPFRTILVGTIR